MTTTPPTPEILPLKRPSTRDDLRAAVQSAAAAGHRLQVQGSNSMPALSSLIPLPSSPAAADSRPVQPLSTLRLSKIVEHAISDMTVIVDAGITLESLQTQLAWHNQWLPIDPPAVSARRPGARTLGGLIATNSLGPLRHGCGDWRLFILGMKFVDATGTLIKGGGRTVKNSAGYSSPRLMIGSCGSLGIIAEITLRTFARPADEQALIIFCQAPQQAEDILAATLLAPVAPAYIQAIGPTAFRSNPLQLPASSIVLVIGFLDRPETCAAQVDLLRQLPAIKQPAPAGPSSVLSPQPSSLETIAQTAAQSARLRLWMTTEPAGDLGFRLHTLSSNVTSLIANIESLASAHRAAAWLVAEAATGVLRGSIASLAPDRTAAFLTQLRTLATSTDSTLILTAAAPPCGKALLASPTLLHGTEALVLSPLYTSLKSQLDPTSLFPDSPAGG